MTQCRKSFNKSIMGVAWFRQIVGHNHKTSTMKQKLPKLNAMKRIMIPVFAIAVSMTACNTTPDSSTTQKAIPPTVDTAGLAEFQAWKAQNELVNTQENTAMQPTREVVKYYPVSSARKSSGTSRSSGVSGSSSGSSGTATTTKKKGWSSAAKGAVIGGVAGAAGGAVINKKNRAAGAVIGGVVGAAGGYGIGRTIDKKNGRY